MDHKWLLVVLVSLLVVLVSYEIIFILWYNIMISSMLGLLYLVLVTDVYMFVLMFDCFTTFYDYSAMMHRPFV